MTDDLSNTFGTPGTRLAGMLPARDKADQAAATTANTDQGTTPERQPATRDSEPDPVGNEPTEAESSADVDSDSAEAADLTTSQVPVYVVPELIPAVRQVREGRTNAEMAFDAIDAVNGRLPELVAKRRTPPTRSGSRFPARDSRRQRGGIRRVLWAIRATGQERTILESIRKEMGAESVSELVSVAVEARYLKKTR